MHLAARSPSAMRQRLDLRTLLSDWPYDPENTVRLVRAADGRELLQVRLPLGVEQYELDGRPDGERPHESESFLDYHLQRLEEAKPARKQKAFSLSPSECADLFAEGVLYYHRYLHLFEIKDWARTARDTARNLRLFDFVKQHAAHRDDQCYLERWRPYLLRMNAVALAMLALDREDHLSALQILQSAIHSIESLDRLEEEAFAIECRRSLGALRQLMGRVESTRPISSLERLERQLKQAIAAQQFERAALLRDRIKALRPS